MKISNIKFKLSKSFSLKILHSKDNMKRKMKNIASDQKEKNNMLPEEIVLEKFC